MDEYVKELMRKNLEVSQESFKILKKMHRARIWGGVFKTIKWIVIIALSVGSYYYVEPYLNKMIDTVSSMSSSMEQIKQTTEALGGGTPGGEAPAGLLEKIKGLMGQ